MCSIFCRGCHKLLSLFVEEDGQDLVEYVLILLLIASVVVASVQSLGLVLAAKYAYVVSKVP